ncbi:MAG: hypothetical protein JJU27_16670 [Gammaproteobacteria bacterium]|nr:hypothetical protein [Gammaproteobacteria bacterium]
MSESQPSTQQAIEVILDTLRLSEQRIVELEARLAERSPDTRELRMQLEQIEATLEATTRERDDWRFETERLNSVVADERKAAHYLRKKLRIAESAPDQAGKKELNFLRGRNEDLEAQLKDSRDATQARESALETRQQEAASALATQAALQARIADLETKLAARSEAGTALQAELDATRDKLDAQRQAHEQALEAQRQAHEHTLAELNARYSALTERASKAEAELEETQTMLRKADESGARSDHERRQLEEQLALDTERMHDLRDEVARLSLRARWAVRRRALVRRLIGEVRARQRANLALKNGIDAMRQYKHAAEQQQHKLLDKYRRLKARMESEHGETGSVAVPPTAGNTHQLVEVGEPSSSGLHRRLQAQTELIEAMERDIERVGSLKRELAARDRRMSELEATISDLRKELELKQALIGTLEVDLHSTMRGKRVDPRLIAAAGREIQADADAAQSAANTKAHSKTESPDAPTHSHAPAQADRAPSDTSEDVQPTKPLEQGAASSFTPAGARLRAGLQALDATRPSKISTGTMKLRTMSEQAGDETSTMKVLGAQSRD